MAFKWPVFLLTSSIIKFDDAFYWLALYQPIYASTVGLSIDIALHQLATAYFITDKTVPLETTKSLGTLQEDECGTHDTPGRILAGMERSVGSRDIKEYDVN